MDRQEESAAAILQIADSMELSSRQQSCTGECKMAIMETKPRVPRAILVGIQTPAVDDVAHAASLEELGRLVKTLGYEVVGTMSQKRDEIDGGTVLGKGRLEELAAITGGTGNVGSMAVVRKSKARERFEDADEKPNAAQIDPGLKRRKGRSS
jgi:GTP-binding protein HflX